MNLKSEAGASVTAGILAGGRSRRFGSNKACAVWKGKTLLEWTVSRAAQMTDTVYILTKDPEQCPVEGSVCIPDRYTVSTPISGILSVMPYVTGGWLLLLACDIPFFDVGVLKLLWQIRDPGKASVIKIGDKYQPFLGLYPSGFLKYWEDSFRKEEYHLQRIVENMPRNVITEEDLVGAGINPDTFHNINTPADLIGLEI